MIIETKYFPTYNFNKKTNCTMVLTDSHTLFAPIIQVP